MQKNGGAARRRFFAFLEKPEGGSQQPPIRARAKSTHLILTAATRRPLAARRYLPWFLSAFLIVWCHAGCLTPFSLFVFHSLFVFAVCPDHSAFFMPCVFCSATLLGHRKSNKSGHTLSVRMLSTPMLGIPCANPRPSMGVLQT